MKELHKDLLKIRISDTSELLGEDAAALVVNTINKLLDTLAEISIIFAAGPSQNEFYKALLNYQQVDWTRVVAFHMDEYLGLPQDAPQLFGHFLHERLFQYLPFKEIHYFSKTVSDPAEECSRYTTLLKHHDPEIVCMGIGMNTHIAFNDPHVADFDDPLWVKVVDMDQECRHQQVRDECFESLDKVPTHAMTLTIPALMKPRYIFCMVPGQHKALAVKYTLTGDINSKYPSTILRNHSNAVLFVDKMSASMVITLS